MSDDELILGQMGTVEENANYLQWRERQERENQRRMAAGDYGDIPDELTDDDERVLTQIHREIAQEDEQKRRHHSRQSRSAM